MKTSDFDYHLPEELIAQHPLKKRDDSRLLVVDRKTKKTEDKHFYDILNYLKNNDFVASNKYSQLLENNFRKEIEKNGSNIKTWAEYDFGQTIAYAWREDLLTSQQAKSRAKTILFLEKR